jgi:cobyrinic acid a,c-diamide synthase
LSTVLAVERGCGLGAGRDGIVKGTVWASYLHLHALGAPRWADGFLGMAARFAAERAATAEAGV